MKSNFNLPKVEAYVIPRTDFKDIGDNPIFPRGDHPDNRSAKEFFSDLGINLIEKKLRSGDARFDMRSINSGRKLMCKCLEDGEIFKSIRMAERFYKLNPGSVSKLKGTLRFARKKGMWFEVGEFL